MYARVRGHLCVCVYLGSEGVCVCVSGSGGVCVRARA